MRINQFMLRTLFAMASAFFSTGFVSTALFTSSLVSAGLFSNDARAHTNEYLDTIDGEHGGQLRMSGAYHFELVIKASAMRVYVTDHAWKPIDTAGASANAMVISEGRKTVVNLQVSGQNTFEGSGDFTVNENTTVHLKVTMPNGDAELVTFTPARKRDAKPAGGEHHDRHKHH